jgi:hypothetical protein
VRGIRNGAAFYYLLQMAVVPFDLHIGFTQSLEENS